MQKIAKELLGLANKKQIAKQTVINKFPSIIRQLIDGTSTGNLSDHRFLLRILEVREAHRLSELAVRLNQNKKKGKSLYNAWMYEESDSIQGLAQAYADRVVFQSCLNRLNSCSEELKASLSDLITLSALDWIEKDLGWFLSKKIFSARMGQKVVQDAQSLCRKVAPIALTLIDAFGIPEHMRHAPIAGDWVSYNKTDNFGELLPEMQNQSKK